MKCIIEASLWLVGTLCLIVGCGEQVVSTSNNLNTQEETRNSDGEEIEIDGFVHAYADNNGVKLHFVSAGSGPLVVMLHGFPDFWYTWRNQMQALKSDFRVVAMDLRGYNLSGQPGGVENYKMPILLDDVAAVIKACGETKATVVGHDWGGAIAWRLAIQRPELVDQLVVCNMVHPTGASKSSLKALKENGNTSYMDVLRAKTEETLPVSWMCGWVKDPEAKAQYEKAFNRSSIDGMLNYYRANTKTKLQRADWLLDSKIPELPAVQVPVLAVFGLQDKYVSKVGLNNTWDWVDAEFTLATFPNAGHFVQQDEPIKVSQTIKRWLLRDNEMP